MTYASSICRKPRGLKQLRSGIRLLHAGPPGGAGGAIHDHDAHIRQPRPDGIRLLKILGLQQCSNDVSDLSTAHASG